MSGLTATGFEIKLLGEILDELRSAELALMGANYLTSSDSIGGQLNGIYGEQLAQLWEVAAAINAGMRRETAVGFQLDDLGNLIGVPRNAATFSTVVIRLGRPNATATFPNTFTVSDPNDPSKKFKLNSPALISAGGFLNLNFTAVNPGAIYANAGTLINIDTPLTGVTTIQHLVDAVPGKNLENDGEYRLRQEISFNVAGTATDGAIRAGLLGVSGVSFASVYYNNTMFTSSDGLPAKSVEAVVEGGTDADIRLMLFKKVAWGIETYGNQTGTVTDVNGNVHTIKFSRPVDVQLYFEADLTVDAAIFPGVATFNQLMMNYVNALQPGQTIVFNKLYDIAFNCPGVIDVYLSLSKTSGATGTTNLNFAKRENPVLQSANCNSGTTEL